MHPSIAVRQSEFWHPLVEGGDENVTRLVKSDLASRNSSPFEDWLDRSLDHLAHKSSRLHDRHNVHLFDPGHHHACSFHFSAGGQQDRTTIREDQATVQERRLSGDNLSPQPSQVANVLILPTKKCIDAASPHRFLGATEALLAKRTHVGSILVVNAKLPVSKIAEIGPHGVAAQPPVRSRGGWRQASLM